MVEIRPANEVSAAISDQEDKNLNTAFGSLLTKFSNAVEQMAKAGIFATSIKLDEDDQEVLGLLLTKGRDAGYRFRLDRTATKTVNEKGQQLGEMEDEYSLYVSLEHLR
jgi:uncharacterized protein YecT (DUF1311 family)